MNSYSALIAESFAGDVLPAIVELAKALENLPIQRCDATDPTTHACTKVTTVSGIDIAAAATRGLVDSEYARTTLQLKDRKGAVTALRNDGTTNAQVTPAYLLTNALGAIDIAFDKYEEQHPDDKDRRSNWRRARSQLVDQFMGVTGAQSTSVFTGPTMTKMTPVIIDILRAQLNAHLPAVVHASLHEVYVGHGRADQEGHRHADRPAGLGRHRHDGGAPRRPGRSRADGDAPPVPARRRLEERSPRKHACLLQRRAPDPPRRSEPRSPLPPPRLRDGRVEGRRQGPRHREEPSSTRRWRCSPR